MENWGDIEESEQLEDMSDLERDSDYNDDMEDEQQFETTFEQEQSAVASVGYTKYCGEPIPFHIKPGTKEYVQAIANKTPLERFKLEVDYVSRILNDSGNSELILSVNDRDKMCEISNDLDIDAKYLNTLAYILGYIVVKKEAIIYMDDTNKEINIKKKRMVDIIGTYQDNFSVLNTINNYASKARSGNSFSVLAPDVIRYSRMWINLMQ